MIYILILKCSTGMLKDLMISRRNAGHINLFMLLNISISITGLPWSNDRDDFYYLAKYLRFLAI